jgi:hypothetical protein
MDNLAGVLEMIRQELKIPLSALGGGEGRGEAGAASALDCAATDLTLPANGRRGRDSA